MAGWTLWQALPLRYQLTCKDIADDSEGSGYYASATSPRVPRSPRPITPRQVNVSHQARAKGSEKKPSTKPQHQQRGGSRPNSNHEKTRKSRDSDTPRGKVVEMVSGQGDQDENHDDTTDEAGTNSRGKAKMYFTVTSPRGKSAEWERRVIAQSSFPSRKSSFIHSFKQQQLINSMRQNFEDPSTVSPRPSPRRPASSAPTTTTTNFPVTKINSNDVNGSPRSHKFSERPRAKTASAKRDYSFDSSNRISETPRSTRGRSRQNSAGAERQPSLIVSSMLPYETTPKPFLKNPLFEEKPSKRYVVRKLDDATMFIDDDKIIFIRKKTTKNDIIQCQKAAGERSYLAHLRKLYLREPKDRVKFVQIPDQNKKTLIRERLEYDKKTDNILNYYSRIDDRENAFAWAMSVEEANRNRDIVTGSCSARAQSSPGMRRESASKPQTPIPERPATSRSIRKKDSSSELYTNRDALSDWNAFVKFNSKSILHERQFYLQTPMANAESKPGQGNGENEESCECKLCHLEMELGRPIITSTPEPSAKGSKKDLICDQKQADKNIGCDAIELSNVIRDNALINDESEKEKSQETKTDEVTSSPKNNKVDKQTSTADDIPYEKSAINLTIDLSSKIISATEIKSREFGSDDYATPSRQTNEEIDAFVKSSREVNDGCPTGANYLDKRGEDVAIGAMRGQEV